MENNGRQMKRREGKTNKREGKRREGKGTENPTGPEVLQPVRLFSF